MRKAIDTLVFNIKELLGNRTLYWLSKESGINQATLGRLEKKKLNPTLESIEYIAGALNVTPAELLTEKLELKVPQDVLEALQNQSPTTYDAIRGILRALHKEKTKKPSRSAQDTQDGKSK